MRWSRIKEEFTALVDRRWRRASSVRFASKTPHAQASGKDGIGSTRCAMKAISSGVRITSTGTRKHGLVREFVIGLGHHFGGRWRWGNTISIGVASIHTWLG